MHWRRGDSTQKGKENQINDSKTTTNLIPAFNRQTLLQPLKMGRCTLGEDSLQAGLLTFTQKVFTYQKLPKIM